jgi:hypothetical protein
VGAQACGTDKSDLGCPTLFVSFTLDAQGQSVHGIVNSNAQTGSHVDHVRLYPMLTAALKLGAWEPLFRPAGASWFSATFLTACAVGCILTPLRG